MTDDTIDAAPQRDLGGCPVKHLVVAADQAAGLYWQQGDELRETTPVFFNDHAQGYWVVSRYEQVKDLYQNAELFSSESFTAWDPDPPYRFVPTQIDPPEHIKYRQLLNPKFSPGAVARREDAMREIAARLIAEVAPRGECDYVAEFAIRFPTEAFLDLIGLPTTDADQLVPWVEDFFLGLNGAPDKQEGMVAALTSIRGYFVELLAARRAAPIDPEADLVSHLLSSKVDGEPLDEVILLDICTVLVLAALDTTRGQLGYLVQHLAEHPEDRRRVIEDPSLVANAVEESLRVHSIIFADARKATRDVEFYGCPVKKGDMVMGLVAAANRDPRRYDRADEFDLDRKGATHFGFAAGPHRCLGAHLARKAMQVAVEEWHKVIPDYRIATDEQLVERGGQLTLLSLPLAWDVDDESLARSKTRSPHTASTTEDAS